MTGFFTLLLRESEAGWVWLYTAGMPTEDRAAHVAELESDAWEHEGEAQSRGDRFAPQFLYRVVLGIPADLGWRLQQGRRGVDRSNWLELAIASLLFFGLAVAVPVAGLMMPFSRGAIDSNGPLGGIIAVCAILVLLVLVLPGVLVIDRWPIPGALLVVSGCGCMLAFFWWEPLASTVIGIGAISAVISALTIRTVRS